MTNFIALGYIKHEMVIKNKNLAFFVDILLVIAGGFLLALGFNLFLFPSEILPSGFSGISTIISVLFQRYLNVNVSMAVVYIILNIILNFCYTIYSILFNFRGDYGDKYDRLVSPVE